ncbi:MAG: hybrid sensor histidine kinase/response regulator [Pegethrix bostrychoides GSE-TBD4-15B]|jgi:chemotaxis family two-component system sensor histidine kinase/response regulator PixL|uniref:histidine kinase n=1 Tax=Pegethrix bostrychoides GSE-TBD4-15B TaxID=2839662 RepID=A0A951U7V9_9CYAN|nr:hybrid sensor histidine kinase/response regulator [Pegethrix bostrychoides GSE-TBD4-15B]
MLNPEIRDQAYQFFAEEVPELLEAIETGLLSLREERSTAKVHEVMRAAHSIKGGAASVELEVIKVIAHRLESIFKALYDETIEIDAALESELLQAYDCLRLPMMEQLETGSIDVEQALTAAEPVFAVLEEKLSEALLQADNYIPTSSDLGIDMVASIFEIDVAQGIDRLTAVCDQPDAYPIAAELQAQAEVFIGLGELLNLPGFEQIAHTALMALQVQPDQELQILRLALADFVVGREAVMQGDRTRGGSPSAALLALTEAPSSVNLTHAELSKAGDSLEDMFSDTDLNADLDLDLDTEVNSDLNADLLFDEAPNFLDLLGSPEGSSNLEAEALPEIAAADAVDAELSDELELAESVELEARGAFDLEPESLEDMFGGAEWEELDETELAIAAPEATDAIPKPRPEPVAAEPLSDVVDIFGATEDLFGSLDAAEFDSPELIAETMTGEVADEVTGKFTGEVAEEVAESFDSPDLLETLNLVTAEPTSVESAIQSAEALFEQLPSLADQPEEVAAQPQTAEESADWKQYLRPSQSAAPAAPTNLSVRVDLHRLERMNNLVGELAINRNSLSLQNEQMQGSVRDLVGRFEQFQSMIGRLQDLSDRMLVTPTSRSANRMAMAGSAASHQASNQVSGITAAFDSLEMDRYSLLHYELQDIFEQVMQIEEALGDVGLFAGQSNQTLNEQRQKMTQLQNELMWARMLPLGNVLNRFPRVLRDLSTKYSKSVGLKLSGAGVLVDKMVLEKLYDPLLHLLRNGFDHGIEMPDARQKQGKPTQGTIEIRAFHRGNQTLIEVSDDGKGLDLQRIGRRAVELGWLSAEELETAKPAQLLEYIFEPGFSTAAQVSELSGRGVGLDVVRSQLRSLKGSVTASSSPGRGTTFTLRIPLTLTVAKLLTCEVGTTAVAVPSDSIEEILVPSAEQIKQAGTQQFLYWREQLVPIYRMSNLLSYGCTLPESSSRDALTAVPTPQGWALPVLVFQREQHSFAVEVDRLITEQELVIRPFGAAIGSPAYTYGCTILGDGSLVPVVDAATLVDLTLGINGAMPMRQAADAPPAPVARQVNTVLVVDDSATLRRMLALTLEKRGYRVLQARDGQEALTHLKQTASVQAVICDIEMPNMNGFEFLSQRRQTPSFAAIPVVMLTSRSNDKHRRLATQLGATAYFSKPYIEHELLGALKNLLEAVPAT